MQERGGARQDFLITFKAGTMEQGADVAPTGDVRFVLMNESASAHDFALVRMGDNGAHGDGWQRRTERIATDDPVLVATADAVPPGDSRTLTVALDAGRYCVVSNSEGEHLGIALFELTVQPVDGSEPG